MRGLTATVEVHLEVMYLLHLLEAVPNGRDVSGLTATVEVHLEVLYHIHLLETVPNGRDVDELTSRERHFSESCSTKIPGGDQELRIVVANVVLSHNGNGAVTQAQL